MTGALRLPALFTALLVLGAGAFLFWADSDRLSPSEREKTKTYAASPASAERDTFTVMTYNLGHLAGVSRDDGPSRADRLYSSHLDAATGIIRAVDPDVIGLQDVDFGAARSGYVHQLDTLAARLGMPAGGQAVRWDDRYLPFSQGSITRPGPILSGLGILSRFPIRRHVRKELPRPEQPFWRRPFSPTPVVQVTALDIGGWPLLVMNVHLSAADASSREEQARTVNRLYRRLSQQGFPILVLGSFNSLMPAVAQNLASNDDTMELLLRGTTLQPALSPEGARITGGSVATHPADNPTRTVDYIFYRPHLIVPTNTAIHCGDETPPSEHCAVSMSFFLPRPVDELPNERIPDDQLPSLDSLLGP